MTRLNTLIFILVFLSGCMPKPSLTSIPQIDRRSKIPTSAIKMTPLMDRHPPQVQSDEFEPAIPLPGEVNTAGGEDSPFVTADGEWLYFFFTPDINIPAEKQILDGVSGIYRARSIDGEWKDVEKVILQDPGKLALDGCAFVQGNVMWFCSVREGFEGINWFTASNNSGKWRGWQLAAFNPDYKVGELHITSQGDVLYFASDRLGGKGGLDIWASKWVDGSWQEPINVVAVNTQEDEILPALNPQNDELWFTRNYSIWRSKKAAEGWQPPELIISSLAGEPSIDPKGNVYFVHHFVDQVMIEADIYVAFRK